MHGKIDRHVEHPRSLGKIHAEKEDVAPAGMREVHSHGCRFPQDGKHARSCGAVARSSEQFGPDPKGVIGRMANTKHPLVAAEAAHAAPHLIGECLEAEVSVGRRKGARDRIRRAVLPLCREECLDRLLKPAVQQMLIPLVRNQSGVSLATPFAIRRQPVRQVKPVDRIQEKQRPHAFVQVCALPPKHLKRSRLRQQLLDGQLAADSIGRAVTGVRLRRRDDRDEP